MASQGTAVITGAAGGLGSACARALAADGYTLVLVDLDETRLAREVEAVSDAGGTARAVALDLLDEDAVASTLGSLPEAASITALVNVAGQVSLGRVQDIDVASWDRVVGVKLRGDFLTCKVIIPFIAANGGGGVVNVSSMSGRTKSLLSGPNYVAANGGVIALTMTLASQHAQDGIRVNCIAPGMIQTPMLSAYTDEQLEAIRKGIPMARFANPAEIAGVASFLLSDKASYITGETVNVNGGMFMV
jgi:NAD(P)-dependent dehydrogenase (short-subunit alcohol dehydrogenase family)